jgi:osmotically-inducible protein OsmY
MRIMLRLPVIIPAALMLLVLLAATDAASVEITDPDIAIAVETRLIKDPGVPLNAVDVNTTEGIVTLTGTVNNILARDRAVKVAGLVKGVRSVVDRIKVEPPPISDRDIRDDIIRAFVFDPLSETWELEVEVEDGKVSLFGTVDSWAEKELVGRIAKGVRGVAELDNNIVVEHKSDRPDSEIREEIDRRLFWDALVTDYLIDVKVDDGKVTLNGTVGSTAERLQAHRDAWVAGVKSVDSTGLEVKWWGRKDNLREDRYALRSDDQIRQAVKDALLYDPRVSGFDIGVRVVNGRVTLFGTVDNLRAKRAAAIDARNTTGVWKVENLIKVRPGTPIDEEIADNILDTFLMDPYVERYEIDVSVFDGEAYLTGTVDSYFEKAHADYLAAGIYGVTEVNNRLRVDDGDVLTYNPYVDPWYTYDYDWYLYPHSIPVKSDREIREDISNEIFWSPFVDGADVTVSVDRGVATLTGRVDSWLEYSAAVENALEGGAVMVDNELELKTTP